MALGGRAVWRRYNPAAGLNKLALEFTEPSSELRRAECRSSSLLLMRRSGPMVLPRSGRGVSFRGVLVGASLWLPVVVVCNDGWGRHWSGAGLWVCGLDVDDVASYWVGCGRTRGLEAVLVLR